MGMDISGGRGASQVSIVLCFKEGWFGAHQHATYGRPSSLWV